MSRKKIKAREKVEKSRNSVCFPMFCGPQGLKSSLAKAAGAQPSGGMRDQELHAAKTQSKLEVKKLKASHVWVIFSGH